jgi:hypothetical protein
LFTNVIDIDQLDLYNQEDQEEQVIDLEARRAMFRLLGPLGKAHNIVVYIHRSSSCTKYFRIKARRLILIDNRTRWNS